MAEILGVASGVVCILDAAISLTDRFLKYVGDFRDEQNERTRLVEDVSVLSGILPHIRKKILDAEASNDDDYRTAVQRLVAQNGPLEQCKLALERINQKLDSKRQKSKSQKNIPELSLMEKLKWPFKLAEIKEDLARIERFKSLAMAIMTSGFTSYVSVLH